MPGPSDRERRGEEGGGSVPNKRFYGEGEPAQDQTGSSIRGEAFYGEAPSPGPGRDAVLRRIARRPTKLGGVFVLFGFGGVFVDQANLLHQIVVGAPVFEELFKIGLALLLVSFLGVRSVFLRFVLAFLPGAGFGLLEHFVTYAGEPELVRWFRVVFHGGTTGLGMVAFSLLESVGDVRLRWATPVPSILVHYVHNVGALILGVAGAVSPALEDVSFGLLGFTTALLYGTVFALWLVRDAVRGWLDRRFPDPGPARFKVVREEG